MLHRFALLNQSTVASRVTFRDSLKTRKNKKFLSLLENSIKAIDVRACYGKENMNARSANLQLVFELFLELLNLWGYHESRVSGVLVPLVVFEVILFSGIERPEGL